MLNLHLIKIRRSTPIEFEQSVIASDHGVLDNEGEKVDGAVFDGVPQDVQALALIDLRLN